MSAVGDYVEDFFGWQGDVAVMLHREIMASGDVIEDFRWGSPVYDGGGGPVCMFRVFSSHITLAFWRGQQMRDLEPRLQPTGSYRMADLRLTGAGEISGPMIQILVRRAVSLNRELGDPSNEKPA